ncbi:MAG: class I SAM-dependent methyltransferase [Candidatus Levybacteria bacterium]|nr:class I SAM-dependent methyltransferase [Candidatus Levybacteria bacterium]
MKNKGHYKKQLDYFGKEFSAIDSYKLASWQKSYIERIKKNMLQKKYDKKQILDIATGSGYVAIEMARLGLNVIATDLTPQALENINNTKKKLGLKNLKTINCYAEKIPVPSESCDFIVANAILEHIPNEKKAINEWIRILKPGGRMMVTVPLRFRYIWPFLWLPNYLHDQKIGHLRRYDKQILESRFKLKVINTYYTGHLIKVFGIILSLLTKKANIVKKYEKLDTKKSNQRYGANNISVIFEKSL